MGDTIFVPKTATDWNDLWLAVQDGDIQRDHDAAFWNERAKTYTHKDSPSTYTERFLKLAGIRSGESVFDMGCGSGNLSIPLGREGHDVLACDFSSVMLDHVTQAIEANGLTTVHPLQLSWEDDWAARGISPNSYDVCLASRSITTRDLRDSLLKLTAVAKRRCCITLATGYSPRVDGRMLKEIDLPISTSCDAVYAIAILQAEGYLPTLDYIPNERADRFDSFESALAKYLDMAQKPAKAAHWDEAELKQKVSAWLEGELVEEKNDGETSFVLRHPRIVNWAFVAWDK